MGHMLNSDSLRSLSHDEFLVDLEDGIRGFSLVKEGNRDACSLERR
jgi:hypothetical protein